MSYFVTALLLLLLLPVLYILRFWQVFYFSLTQPDLGHKRTNIQCTFPLSVRDPSLTLTQFCARLKTVLFCRAYETLA